MAGAFYSLENEFHSMPGTHAGMSNAAKGIHLAAKGMHLESKGMSGTSQGMSKAAKGMHFDSKGMSGDFQGCPMMKPSPRAPGEKLLNAGHEFHRDGHHCDQRASVGRFVLGDRLVFRLVVV